MKTPTNMSFKLYFILIILLISPYYGWSQYNESKNIDKTFSVNPSTTLEVSNKYGKIHLVSWDRDSVQIKIDVDVTSTNSSRLRKVMNNIDFDIMQTEYYIVAETKFNNSFGSFFQDLKNITESLIPSNDNVTIDYLIMAPKYLNIKLDNRYGDIYCDDLTGDVQINLSNGDLKANDLLGDADINVRMGDAVINEVRKGIIDINYSDLRIKKSDNLKIKSNSSKVNLEKVDFIKIDSRRDKYYIEELNQVFGSTYFSELWIYNLYKKSNLKLKYGNLNLENVESEFSLLDLHSEYTDMNIFFDQSASYQVDIKHVNVNLSYPKTANLKKERLTEDDDVYVTFGKIGSSDPGSKVDITAKKCSIMILHK